jgi:hypothetical protein
MKQLEDLQNKEAIEELVWTLEASSGHFKLILARCKYLRLRSHLINSLQSLTDIQIQIVNLSKTDKILYAKIQHEIKDKQPDALMVLGLESVADLQHLLSAANLVREEFRKNFHFPVILWVTDDVLEQIMRLASDFESWATTTEFVYPTNELIKSLQEDSDAFFSIAFSSDTYSIGWQMGYLRRQEIAIALKDLHQRGQHLEPTLKASVEFVRGQDAYLRNQIEEALEHYYNSLAFWYQDFLDDPPGRLENINPTSFHLRAGVLLFYIGLCYFQKAEQHRQGCSVECVTQKHSYLEAAKKYFSECIAIFGEETYPNLVAKFINPLGEVLQRLEAWEELRHLAQKSLNLQRLYGNPARVAQAYGFLAEVALSKQQWSQVKHNAHKALHNIGKFKLGQYHQQRSLYLFLLAQAERHLRQLSRSLKHLQAAKDCAIQDNPYQYIRILQALRSLLWEQKCYLEAFRTKLEQRSVEQQYGFRAFIGAGRIQPQRQVKPALTQIVDTLHIPSLQETIAPEITASGRRQDIERLLERIARPDYKLIIIHGYSGVGKSSLVQAGLIPALKQKTIGFQDVLPISIAVYTNWERELLNLITLALEAKGIIKTTQRVYSHSHLPTNILDILQSAEVYNIRIVLIFDQFEELFFVDQSVMDRRKFFDFLGECLNLLGIKVVLLLREDYLHYLLECNRLPSMSIINNDILSKNVLYQLGNFTREDAKSLIENLTKHSNFRLEAALIEQLVEDLAARFDEVRPIELQVVGAQLQTENITTLLSYQKYGPQEELVKRYLHEVVEDCGVENKQVAELLLYLLTDEKGTRPLKTRAQLVQDLRSLGADVTTQSNQLNLVLQIFVESGIVVIVPENPNDRYQLVHDYLAAFIQKQQKPKLNELIVELNEERSQRKLSEDRLNKVYQSVIYAIIILLLIIFLLGVIVTINY